MREVLSGRALEIAAAQALGVAGPAPAYLTDSDAIQTAVGAFVTDTKIRFSIQPTADGVTLTVAIWQGADAPPDVYVASGATPPEALLRVLVRWKTAGG
jgi:hypothetical protein